MHVQYLLSHTLYSHVLMQVQHHIVLRCFMIYSFYFDIKVDQLS